MRDPIERQDAIDALQKEIDKWTPPFDHVIGAVRCGVRLARNIIEDLPSAERKTGKWLPDTKTFEMMFVCSECKASLHVDTINLKPSWDYCPNCGTYMGDDTNEVD